MRRAPLLLSMILILAAVAMGRRPAVAQEADRGVSVVAEVGEDRVYLGESTLFVIRVTGTDAVEAPPTTEFDGDDLDVRYLGPVNRSHEVVQIVGGRQTRETYSAVHLRYEVRPRRAGTLTIPSLTVVHGRERHRTRPVTLEVIGPRESDVVRLELRFSRDRVYVEQSVDFELHVLVRPAEFPEAEGGGRYDGDPWSGSIPPALTVPWFQDLAGFEGPDFERFAGALLSDRGEGGFTINGLGRDTFFGGSELHRFDLQRRERTVDGRIWFDYVLRKTLRPLEAGPVEIPPATLRGELVRAVGRGDRGLVGTDSAQVFVASPPRTLHVLPVPEAVRPPTYSHAVGLYEVSSDVEPRRAKVGDPLLLSVSVQGSGLIQRMEPPRLSAQASLTKGFAVGESQVPTETGDGSRVFHFTIRPRDTSVTEVPPVVLAFFDPASETFRTTQSEPIPISVEEAVAVGSAEVVQQGGDDSAGSRSAPGEERAGGLLGNASIEETLRDETLRPLRRPVTWLALCLPPLLLAAAWVLGARRRRGQGDPVRLRSERALATALAALGEVCDAPAAGLDTVTAEALHRALVGYVGDRIGRTPAGMTAADAEAELRARGVETAAAGHLVAALRGCEASRYGGGPGGDLAAWIDGAPDWVRTLEQEGFR